MLGSFCTFETGVTLAGLCGNATHHSAMAPNQRDSRAHGQQRKRRRTPASLACTITLLIFATICQYHYRVRAIISGAIRSSRPPCCRWWCKDPCSIRAAPRFFFFKFPATRRNIRRPQNKFSDTVENNILEYRRPSQLSIGPEFIRFRHRCNCNIKRSRHACKTARCVALGGQRSAGAVSIAAGGVNLCPTQAIPAGYTRPSSIKNTMFTYPSLQALFSSAFGKPFPSGYQSLRPPAQEASNDRCFTVSIKDRRNGCAFQKYRESHRNLNGRRPTASPVTVIGKRSIFSPPRPGVHLPGHKFFQLSSVHILPEKISYR